MTGRARDPVRAAGVANDLAETLAILVLFRVPFARALLLAALVVRALLWWRHRDLAAEEAHARRWFPWIGAVGSALPLLFVIFTGRAAMLAYAAAVLAIAGGWLYRLMLASASTSASLGKPRVSARE